MIGKTVSHYKIREKIGEGGMGIVYKARDTKLDRDVALKFLHPEFTRDEEAKARFINEAQAASALQHHNICTIHDIDETPDGQLFIVLDYYEGETLKNRITSRESVGTIPRIALKIDECINIAIQIAEGLAKAHEKGIIHRDIKSANILIIKDGVVKILDFGLAKLAGKAQLTKDHSTCGTAAYMSPEQLMGGEIDQRTDIWSLGVVFYEMLTGVLPFTGDYEQAVLYSILNDDTKLPTSLQNEIPGPLERIVIKTLEKKPERRYQHIRDLLKELKHPLLSRAGLDENKKSIIVLPFEDLSPEHDQDYFSDGLTEEIISDLSTVQVLRVISRSSSMTFKGTRKKIPEIARDVNVQYVLEGSVRKVGNSLRITAQLIDAPNDAHLWAEKYSGTLDDVFDIQEKVSRSILEAMRLKLAPAEEERINRRPISDVRAYEYYLKAMAEIEKFTEAGTKEAERFLQNAVALTGENALLCAGLASTRINLVNIGISHEESLADAERYLQKALALEPELPQAHIWLGWLRMYAGERQAAVYHLKKSIALGSNETIGMVMLASLYMCAGKMSPVALLCERALQIDPVAYPVHWAQGGRYFYDGQFDKAREAWRRMHRMFPENPYSRFAFALILIYDKKYDEAFQIIEENLTKDPTNVLSTLGAMLKFAVLSERNRAEQEMTSDFRKSCLRDLTYSHHMAGVFALFGDTGEAMDWLENAVGLGFINYPFLVEKDPLLAKIRGDERFKKLMRRVKKEWEEFEV